MPQLPSFSPLLPLATRQERAWAVFTSWCASKQSAALPATLATYLSALAVGAPGIDLALAAITAAHKAAGLDSPRDSTVVRPGRASPPSCAACSSRCRWCWLPAIAVNGRSASAGRAWHQRPPEDTQGVLKSPERSPSLHARDVSGIFFENPVPSRRAPL